MAATFPVEALDELVAVHPDARLLVDYDRSGYAIHRLHPHGGRVFIDGRSDMYPRAIFEDYLRLREADNSWQQRLDGYEVEAILLPPQTPLLKAAEAAGWCTAHRDQRSVLLLREYP